MRILVVLMAIDVFQYKLSKIKGFQDRHWCIDTWCHEGA